MGMRLAQEFEIVRGEIDHQQPPAGTQHPRRFLQRPRRILEEVQHLVDDHHVEGVARQSEAVDVALAHRAVLRPCPLQIGAGDAEHVGGKIDADAALDLRREQLQYPPGAGAEIEQAADPHAVQRLADRRFHLLIRGVQAAYGVPFMGMGAEIGLRARRPRRPHRVEPLAVAQQHVIVRRHQLQQRVGHRRARRVGGTPIEHPARLAEPLDQAGFRQQFEMTGDSGLRLAENVGKLRHRQLALAHQRQQAQPRILAGRLEAVEQERETERRSRHGRTQPFKADIKISLCLISTRRKGRARRGRTWNQRERHVTDSNDSDATLPYPEFGIRPGEVAGELPAAFDAGLYYIGRIRTPWTRRADCPKNARRSDALCTVELAPPSSRRWRDWTARAMSGCSISWTARRATCWSRCRIPMARAAAPSPCAARPGPIRSP